MEENKLRFINEIDLKCPRVILFSCTQFYSDNGIKIENEEHLLERMFLININPFLDNNQLKERDFSKK